MLACNCDSCLSVKLPPFKLQGTNKHTYNEVNFFKIVKALPSSCVTQNKALSMLPPC